MVFTHELSVERRRTHVGEDAARRVDRVAARDLDGYRAASVDDDARHGRRAADLAAASNQASDERGRELTRATLRDREAVLLPEAGEEPSEKSTRRCGRIDVAVQRVTREEQRSTFTAKLFCRELAYRQQRQAREVEEAARTERKRETGRTAYRGDRTDHGVHQRVGDALVVRVAVAPRVAVARRVLLQRLGGFTDRRRQHRAAAVGGGMRERER